MSALFDEPRRCNLTLVACRELTGPISLDRLRRVREPVSRSKTGVQGKVADVVHGRSRHAESANELKAFRILLATARSAIWQEQPFCLEYHYDGAKHRYTPDILVVWGAHQEVVEVQEDSESELPENQAQFRLVGELLAEHGFHFRLWKRSEICAEPRLTNVDLILRYRCVDISAVDRERIRHTLSPAPDWHLRSLCETSQTAVQNVLRLVLDGTLHIDWWEPLSLDSKVSILPIGRQIWPCPPLGRIPLLEARCY